ncbi:MAG: hypothetical protein WC083_04185 [Candidatus Methanomethylophilaceae archaeon]
MSIDERVRDPERSSAIASEGLSSDVLSMIFLETLRQMFMSSDNFATHRMRYRNPPLLWSSDVAKSKIRIIRAEDWKPQDEGMMPMLLVRSQGTTMAGLNIDGTIDPVEETIESPERIAYMVIGRVVLWAVSPDPNEANSIAWEAMLFYAAFSRPICQEHGIGKLSPAGVGPPVRLKEKKGVWGVPLTIAIQWQVTQELSEQQPVLSDIRTDMRFG